MDTSAIIARAALRVAELESAVATCPPDLRGRYQDDLWDARLVLEHWETGGDA